MNSGESGLNQIRRLPVAVRVADQKITHYSGESLNVLMNRFLIGVFGDTGVGKSFTIFSILEDHVENRAHEDEWIRAVFHFDAVLQEKILASDEKTRRSYLRAAHKIIFLDFDTLGAQPLFQSHTCNPALFRCFEYFPCSTWEDAYGAMKKAIAILDEHSKHWGEVGCWIVVDNATRAWAACRADYGQSLTGTDMNTLMADIRLNNPGRDSAARKVQAEKLNDLMDYAVINPAHNEEWVDIMVGSGFNILFMSPPKQFEVEVGQQGGKPINEKVNNLGGAKNNRHQMHYIWRKYVSEDGHTFYAEMTKTRYTGNKGEVISNPTWSRMRKEMQRIENEHQAAKDIRNAKFDYFDIETPGDFTDVVPPIVSVKDVMDTVIPIDLDLNIDISPDDEEPTPTNIIDIDLDDDFPGLDSIVQETDIETPSEPTEILEPTETTPEPEESVETAQDPPEINVSTETGTWIVSPKDRGRGNYHRPDCGVVKRMKFKEETIDPGERKACLRCIGEPNPEPETTEEEDDWDLNL